MQAMPLPNDLLMSAHARVLREMMKWVYDNPPSAYLEDKQKIEAEIQQRAQEKTRQTRQAAAESLPPAPAVGPSTPAQHTPAEAGPIPRKY